MLSTQSFTELDLTTMKKIKDVHSWRWCWACGKRYMLVSLGVSLFTLLTLINKALIVREEAYMCGI